MLRIEPQSRYTVEKKKLVKGDFKTIIVLSNKDLEDLKYIELLCGILCDLIIVPRELTEEELSIINLSIYDGVDKVGKIVIL